MSEHFFSFDSYLLDGQEIPVRDPNTTTINDLQDTLFNDLKLPDSTLNEILSEFDLNPSDLHCFSTANDAHSSPSSSSSSSPSPSTIVQTHSQPSFFPHTSSTTMMTSESAQLQSIQAGINQPLSGNALKFLIEQQQQQPVKRSPQSHFSPFHSTSPLQYEEPSARLATYNPPPPPPPTTANHIQLAIPLPKLVKKPEPIPVTLDQFQALLRAHTDSSNNSISTLLENSTIIGNNIPLKLVSASDDSHQSQSSLSIKASNETSSARPRRKSSHNAIEKRYRSSINEKILELKEIVAQNDGKIQKSAILRRAIEFIRQLQLTNARLEEENTTLKNILKRFHLTNVPTNSHVQERKSSVDPTSTPPAPPSVCSSESNESTLGSSDEPSSPEAKRPKRSESKPGMVNGARLMLCCFMFCILITNPFGYLLNFLHSSNNDDLFGIESRISSRTLQGLNEEDSMKFFFLFGLTWKQLIGWMLNMAICFVCLIKLFVHGDPIVHRTEMKEYYARKKTADQLMEDNQLIEARRVYHQCCEQLYVPMNEQILSKFSSFTWQSIRLILNLIFVGRWLTYWSGWSKSIDTRDYNRELTKCFLQLWRIDYQLSKSTMDLLHLALSTINTSINTGKKLDPVLRNEIVLLFALTLKKSNRLASMFIPLTLKFLVPMEMKDLDLFQEFLVENSIDLFKEKTLIQSIQTEFIEYVLYHQIRNQLLVQDDQDIGRKIDGEFSKYVWWQHCLQLMRCITHDTEHINHLTSTNELRQIKSAEKTIYFSARIEQITDERYIIIVETIHRILLVLTDDERLTETNRMFLLEKLNETSRLLISRMETRWNSNGNALDLAIKTLLFDGILSLRLRLLSSSISTTHPTIPYLDHFGKELEHYKGLIQPMKLPKQRFYLFESIFRASSGLNPLATQTLFERAIKPSKKTIECQEGSLPTLDIIAALLLFCHLLPSTVYHYRDLLQRVVIQSGNTKHNYDLQRLQQRCLALIRQPYLTL